MSGAGNPLIVLTSGEPAGIGPDLCLAVARQSFPGRIAILGDRDMLAERARRLRLPCDYPDYLANTSAPVSIANIRTAQPVEPGKLQAGNAAYVLELLDRAITGCSDGEFAAMVTAPVHKAIINEAGVPFTGHTEYLQQRSRAPHVVMMLVGGGLRVALATIHMPLSAVPRAITTDLLVATLRVMHQDLRVRFGIAEPRILVAGLNPHAGEGGHLGREEIDVIAPALTRLQKEGLRVTGPLPADTLFTPRQLQHADAVLAMYHDQGLAVLKYASFGKGVNITLGLPFIRTSVDHGTALDLAGSGAADAGSLIAAINLALELARRQP